MHAWCALQKKKKTFFKNDRPDPLTMHGKKQKPSKQSNSTLTLSLSLIYFVNFPFPFIHSFFSLPLCAYSFLALTIDLIGACFLLQEEPTPTNTLTKQREDTDCRTITPSRKKIPRLLRHISLTSRYVPIANKRMIIRGLAPSIYPPLLPHSTRPIPFLPTNL